MKQVIVDTLLDCFMLIPFLFLVFLVMEFFEHKIKESTKSVITKSGKYGPFLGGILGAIPQCGFSVAATNLYVCRIISLGTLISVYLSTSDEMLPILITNKAGFNLIARIVLIKVVIGIIFGILIDMFYRKSSESKIKDFCHDEHCHCEHGIVKSALYHTIKIMAFILIVELVLNGGFHYLGKARIKRVLMTNSNFAPIITSMLGLIPNCASSVIITELFVNGTIKFGSLIGGLLTGSGVALLVLFKENHNIKESLIITALLYIIGVACGIFINLLALV